MVEIVYDKTVFPEHLNPSEKEKQAGMVYDRSFDKPPDLTESREAGYKYGQNIAEQRQKAAIYDKTPSMGGKEPEIPLPAPDDGERMSEGEIKPVEILYEQSPQFYEKDFPVVIPMLGSEKGEVDKVYLKDAATLAINKIQEAFDKGTDGEVLDHWVKVCEDSPFVDRNLMPKIRELAEMGKAVMTYGQLENFLSALKEFRRSVRIKDNQIKGGK